MTDQRIREVVRRVASLLAHGDYDALERLSRGKRLTAAELKQAVQEYGRTLVMPPDEAFERLDVVDVDAFSPKRHGVRLDLWTAQEGRSDLTLEITITDTGPESYDVQIDDLHVL